jgi:hypothetical protein
VIKVRLRDGAIALAVALVGADLTAVPSAASRALNDQLYLYLSGAQENVILRSVNRQGVRRQTMPADFVPDIGLRVPASVKLRPLPADATRRVPNARSFAYVMLKNQLLIVNPRDRRIVDIIWP